MVGVLLWLVLLGSLRCMSREGSCWSPAELRTPAQPEALQPHGGQTLSFSGSNLGGHCPELAAAGDVVQGAVQPYCSLGLSPKSGGGIALKVMEEPFAVAQTLAPCQTAGTG